MQQSTSLRRPTRTEATGINSDAGIKSDAGIAVTLGSLMNLTRQERHALIQAYHEAAWACHVVFMMDNSPSMSPEAFKSACDRYAHGNDVAARIAHDYLVLGKDTKLPIVPPEWYRAMEDALKRNRAETT